MPVLPVDQIAELNLPVGGQIQGQGEIAVFEPLEGQRLPVPVVQFADQMDRPGGGRRFRRQPEGDLADRLGFEKLFF